MKGLKRPHDSFFKRLMSDIEVVREFLKGVLPGELSRAIDYKSIRIADTEKVTRRYRKYFLDLSVECDLADKESLIYFVFEHKSYPDRLTHIQILNYSTAVWEQNIRIGENPVPIIPIVFYHGKRRFNLPVQYSDYYNVPDALKKYLLDFRIVLFDTTQIEDHEIVTFTNNLYLSASLLTMKHIFEDLKGLEPAFKHMVKLDRDRFLMVLEYVIMSKKIDEKELDKILRESGVKTMPSLAQKWLEEGIQQGIQQGLKQGMLQDAQEMVIEVLEERFGIPSPGLLAKIKAITVRETLKALHKRAIRAKSLDEFKAELKRALEE